MVLSTLFNIVVIISRLAIIIFSLRLPSLFSVGSVWYLLLSLVQNYFFADRTILHWAIVFFSYTKNVRVNIIENASCHPPECKKCHHCLLRSIDVIVCFHSFRASTDTWFLKKDIFIFTYHHYSGQQNSHLSFLEFSSLLDSPFWTGHPVLEWLSSYIHLQQKIQ